MAAPPAFYAQKLAHRALAYYLAEGSDTASASSSGRTSLAEGDTASTSSSSRTSAPGDGPKQLPEIKNELKGSMFYC